jgi:aspartate kinase
MGIVVQKFGGTSVGNIKKIFNVANKVIKEVEAGNRVVVVVSAMSGETDRLVNLALSIDENAVDDREYDVIISTGEQVTIGLLSLALKKLGYKAKSFLGFQIPIITDNVFSKARILSIESKNILNALNNGYIAVVAGFQGRDDKGNITTLGRGGSDTSAVAIAAVIDADRCDIYTDVDGVYTTDPNICKNAKKLESISYEEMLEFASLGAKVLQLRSVEFAQKYNVKLQVRSSFQDNPGTIVCKEDEKMESPLVTGVAYDKNQAKISIIKVPDKPGIAAKIFNAIAESNINVDMIVQNISEEDCCTDLTFTVTKVDFKKALEISKKVAKQIGAKEVIGDDRISKVSVIGVGMRSHYGIASKMFTLLADEHINLQMISTSEIKISCIVEEKYTELAVRTLHDGFNLGKNEE